MSIPIELCQCGCGRKTWISTKTDRKHDMVRGRPVKFCRGHAQRTKHSSLPNPNQSGFCQCGCGRKTTIAKQTSRRDGQVKGFSVKFVTGHGHKVFWRNRNNIEKVFWSKVKVGLPDECWEWQGRTNEDGYGLFQSKALGEKAAHRISYRLTYGNIPDRLCVLHECDFPPCCNPKHLFLGTRLDNNDDRVNKNRSALGRAYPNAVLTEESVRYIRYCVKQGIPQSKLANQYGVSSTCINYVVKRKTWSYVT